MKTLTLIILFTSLSFAQSKSYKFSVFYCDDLTKPNQIPGLVAWYEGDYVSATGSLVESWTDLSGNNHNVPKVSDASRPSWDAAGLNGKYTLGFDGLAQRLKVQFTHNQPETIYLVAKINTWQANDFIFSGYAVNAYFYLFSATPIIAIRAGSTISDNKYTVGQWAIFKLVFNGAASSIQINNLAVVTGDAGTTNSDGLNIGSLHNASGMTDMDVAAMIIYGRVVTAPEDVKIKAYLNNKYKVF